MQETSSKNQERREPLERDKAVVKTTTQNNGHGVWTTGHFRLLMKRESEARPGQDQGHAGLEATLSPSPLTPHPCVITIVPLQL